jgi:hypothetical protein
VPAAKVKSARLQQPTKLPDMRERTDREVETLSIFDPRC